MPLKNQLTLAVFIAKFSSEKASHEYLNRRNMDLFELLVVAVGCSFLPD